MENTSPEKNIIINNIFDSLLKYINETQWCGACYMSSAIAHIVLNEFNIKSELCIGESVIAHPGEINKYTYYDHSWVVIDEKIYDVAITNQRDSLFSKEPTDPVFFHFNRNTKITFSPNNIAHCGIRAYSNDKNLVYGVNIDGLTKNYDELKIPHAHEIYENMPFDVFMDIKRPDININGWEILANLLDQLGIQKSISDLKQSYNLVKFKLIATSPKEFNYLSTCDFYNK